MVLVYPLLMASVGDRGSLASRCLERAWARLREVEPCVPPVVIVLVPVGRKQGKLGHFSGLVWRAGRGERGHELAINPVLFDRPEDLLGTLVHEAAHALLFEWGLRGGCGPDGYFHREEFRGVCERLGLVCSFRNRRYGWSDTAWPVAGVPMKYRSVLRLLTRELPWGLRRPG